MSLKSLKSRVNSQKTYPIRGKIAKFAPAFIQNKPNFKNIKIGVSSFETGKYEILTARRGKKQTQFKPNTNPIHKRPKMNANICNTKIYGNKTFFLAPKTKPNKPKVANNQLSLIDNQLRRQTQFKAKQIYPRMSLSGTQILIKFINSCYTKTPSENDGNEVDICSILCNYIKQLIWFFNLGGGSQAQLRFGIANHAETSSN